MRSAQSLDLIITDDGLDAATVAEFRAAGVNLVVADRMPPPARLDSLAANGRIASVCVRSSRRWTGGCSGPRS